MSKLRVTTDDRTLADMLVRALLKMTRTTPDSASKALSPEALHEAREAVAQWIAQVHERAVLCAVVRAERERVRDKGVPE